MTDQSPEPQGKPDDLKAIEQGLDRLQAERSSRTKSGRAAPKSVKGAGQGMKMATDMVAAVGIGGLFGWGLDYLTGTLPLFFLIFLLLGVAAGILNVYRSAQGLEGGFAENRRRSQAAQKNNKS